MPAADRSAPHVLRRPVEAVLGGAAGALAGTVLVLLLHQQGMMASGALSVSGALPGLVPQLVVAVTAGAAFGAVFRYQPAGAAATLSSGLLLGLLAWIGWTLTLVPVLDGRLPTWSAADARTSFSSLVGSLLYGALTGTAFHVLARRWATAHPPTARRRPRARATRVVVVGGGFAGVAAVQRLERLFPEDGTLDLTLVSRSNYLLFTPMLAEVASGALQPPHISTPLRAACRYTRVRRGTVTAVDVDGRVLTLSPGGDRPEETLRFDHLLLALGAVPSFADVPGVAEHAFTLATLEDATVLRSHVLAMLERADREPDSDARRALVTFVVAGGGFAGTELVAELHDLVADVRHLYPGVRTEDARFVLVHSRDRILPEIGDDLAAYALAKLRTRGIEVLLGTRVAAAGVDTVSLDDGGEIAGRTLVWTAGTRPNPLLGRLGVETSRGAVVVEPTLQVGGRPGLWAVGDCARIADPGEPGGFYPPTAQHATREGRAVADSIAAVIRGQAPPVFRFRTLGVLVALGHHTAVAEIRGRQFSGLLAWLMWRGVYLGKLPGLDKKLRVLLDWSIDLVFPRDVVVTETAGDGSVPMRSADPGPAVATRTGR